METNETAEARVKRLNRTRPPVAVKVPADSVPKRWGDYQWDVLLYGHVPGRLSGADLRGKASQYGSSYRRRRWAVEEFAARHGVRAAMTYYAGSPSKANVWIRERDGRCVEFHLNQGVSA